MQVAMRVAVVAVGALNLWRMGRCLICQNLTPLDPFPRLLGIGMPNKWALMRDHFPSFTLGSRLGVRALNLEDEVLLLLFK